MEENGQVFFSEEHEEKPRSSTFSSNKDNDKLLSLSFSGILDPEVDVGLISKMADGVQPRPPV